MMSTRESFVEAMRAARDTFLHHIHQCDYVDAHKVCSRFDAACRKLAVAFIDNQCRETNGWMHAEICGRNCRCELPSQHEVKCRAALLRECGLEKEPQQTCGTCGSKLDDMATSCPDCQCTERET